MRCARQYSTLKHAQKYSVNKMRDVLKCSESGYYRWLRNRNNPRKQDFLLVEIEKVVGENRFNKNYGRKRVFLALEQRGYETSESSVYRVMKKYGMSHKRKRPHGITKSTTEVQEKEVCTDTLMQLRNKYGRLDGAIIHSDRGSQYTSEAFRDAVKNCGMKQSLSGTGNCYDNTRIESFFATLKKELLYQIPTHLMTIEEVKQEVFRYIFTYYNRERVYTTNPGGLPPAVYGRQLLNKMA